MAAISSIGRPVSKIIVLTNEKFKQQFEDWAKNKGSRNLQIVSDGSQSEENKPGAVGALAALGTIEEMLIVAGDNLTTDNLADFIEYFNEKHSPVIALYRAAQRDQLTRGSVATIDSSGKITDFKEKPANPEGDLVGAVIYAFPPNIRNRLMEYIELQLPRDEPGRFIEWLHKKEPVYGYVLRETVWDIGTIDSYNKINKMFSTS